MNDSHQHSFLHSLLLIAGLALVYFIAGYLGLFLAIPSSYVTPVWPASGFALAALLLLGRQLWPGILIGSILINLKISFDPTTIETALETSILAISIGFGASMQALFGRYLILSKVKLQDGLLHGREVVWFLVLGGPISCLVGASWGVTTLWFFDFVPNSEIAFSWATWWLGDAIGVLLMVPLIFIFLGKPREVWVIRRIRVAIPMLVTLIVIFLTFLLVSHQAQSQIESELRAKSMVLGNSLEKVIEKNIEVLYSIQSLFSRPETVGHDEFQRYVERALGRNSSIQALSWNLVISHRQRASFEQNAKSWGLSELGITERNPSGKLVAAGKREKYIAVSFIAPLEGNQKALGYDVYSNPARKQALSQACVSGDLVATDPVKLVQESGNQNGVLFFLPVYKNGLISEHIEQRCSQLVGYVVGVFRTGDLLAEAIEGVESADMDVHLVDGSSADKPRHLAYRLSDKPDHEPVFDIDAVPAFPSNLFWEKTYSIGQRSWMLKIGASNNYIANHRSWAGWGVLAGGLVFTASLGMFLLILTGRGILDQERARELASEVSKREQSEQTLSDANEKLEKLAKTDSLTQINNRLFIQELGKTLDAETRRYQIQYTALLMDIDHFKSVNDRWGHQTGDLVLQKITRLVNAELRDSDYFGRWGGEEFIVIARNTSLDESIAFAERLCEVISQQEIEPVGRVTMSIGVTSNKGKAMFDKVIQLADKALYQAKENGRNRVESAT